MVDRAFRDEQEMFTALLKSLPAGRIARKEEVSDVVMFLSSPRASYVTGIGLLVDGGTTLQMKL